MNEHHYSLLQLNGMVREAIERCLPREYWVEAELSELRENNGHCYMHLVEKSPDGNTPIANAQARCWRNTWTLIRPHFERVTGQSLRPGMKVLLCVYPQFHENYGFSWIVTDIDPTFTLGDMARRRMEIIKTLKDEGVFDLNKELTLPMFAQHIAVISSATAAGYGDFCDQLTNNLYGFKFTTRLFQATMQGENVEQSVVSALNSIYDMVDEFDAVVIIRGGGATSDLSGFDSLLLAENVANFPLPVITGIGHDRDESIIDMISHTRVKTPTAAAAFLIEHLLTVSDRINSARQRITSSITQRMETEQLRLGTIPERIRASARQTMTAARHRMEMLSSRLPAATATRISDSRHHIDLLEHSIRPAVTRKIEREQQRIALLTQRTKAVDPTLLLARGYSITLFNGKAVRDASSLNDGDEVETRVQKGSFKSIVKPKAKNK